MLIAVSIVAAAVAGVAVGLLIGRSRADAVAAGLRSQLEASQAARIAAESKAAHLEASRSEMETTFEALAQRALRSVSESVVQLSRTQVDGSLETKRAEIEAMLGPLREMLSSYREELTRSERVRNQIYGGLQEQLRGLMSAQEAMRQETARLATALKSPTVQGAWGEVMLRRCLELAGMTEHCHDFVSQQTFVTEEGKRIRPDVIVNLPTKRVIAIDAKAPLTEYIAACNENDEERRHTLLEQHAKNIRRHIDALSKREYQGSIGETLDFTLMFIPGDHFLFAALGADPTLFDYSVEKRVFLTSPTLLLPLLLGIAASWKEERTEQNVKRLHEAGVELFNRFARVMDMIAAVGTSLATTVDRYNSAIRSIDTRLWPKGEELQRMAGSGKELGELKQLDTVPIESSKWKLRAQSNEEGEVVPFES